ncbi:predicted protein [Botrytis cinerea T4]|uniref:Uncharacterized protein n=1 Tax=Botryotinia fuckeliana (strain T4) TaxID=999810 RepID=G2YWZ6_BOTF4|nr:predicted protein [Botrytis cinerea T4]
MTYENISFVGFCSQAITKQLVLGSIVAGITLFAAIDRIDTIWSISYVIVPHKANNNSCRHSIFPTTSTSTSPAFPLHSSFLLFSRTQTCPIPS